MRARAGEDMREAAEKGHAEVEVLLPEPAMGMDGVCVNMDGRCVCQHLSDFEAQPNTQTDK